MSVALPRIEPVRPRLEKHVPTGRGWSYELKLDGFRGVLHVDGRRAYFVSKHGRVMKRFQALAESLAAALGVRSAILDGEIVVMTGGRPDFYALMFRRGSPEFSAFDLLYLDGRDLRSLPLAKRKAKLRTLLDSQDAIGFVESHSSAALFEAAARLDLEGIVAKRTRDPYGPGTEWVKVKHPGYSQMEGRWELFRRNPSS